MSENLQKPDDDREGVSINVNKKFFIKMNATTAKKVYKWTKAVFFTLLTLSGITNYYGIKITRESITNNASQVEQNANKIATVESDISALQKANQENSLLRQTIGNLTDKLDAFLKNPRSRVARQDLDKEIIKAKQQIGKPISVDLLPRADKSLPVVDDFTHRKNERLNNE
jgi:hypothetical protein